MTINENWVTVIKALIPFLAAIITISFKLSQTQRELLAHAVERALGFLSDGTISSDEAKSAILATGTVAAEKVDKLVDAVEVRMNGGTIEVHAQDLIPGVNVAVDSKGNVAVNPTGALNKAAHKVNKWVKNKLGLKIF